MLHVPSVPLPSPLLLEGDIEENFDFFEKSWNDYVKATGMNKWPTTHAEQKVSYLLSVIGEEAKKKFFNFELTSEERASPEAALIAIRKKIVPKRNILLDRMDFFNAEQFSYESIDEYSTRLKLLAKVAKLGALSDELIVYKLATSNKWPQLRQRMLCMTDLTIQIIVDICRVEEISMKRVKETDVESSVKKISKFINKQNNKCHLKKCKFCGNEHEFVKGACPAYGKKCYRCNGKNHFEKVCRKQPRNVKEIKDMSSINDTSSEDEEQYMIGKVIDNSSNGGSVAAELLLKYDSKWKKVLCEIDTGASTCLIGQDQLWNLWKSSLKIPASKIRLQAFGGFPINVLGEIRISCRRNGKRYKILFQVVEGDHRPLLSAKASRELGLVKYCNNVTVNESFTDPENILKKYRTKAEKIAADHDNLFAGYGKFEGKLHWKLTSRLRRLYNHQDVFQSLYEVNSKPSYQH